MKLFIGIIFFFLLLFIFCSLQLSRQCEEWEEQEKIDNYLSDK